MKKGYIRLKMGFGTALLLVLITSLVIAALYAVSQYRSMGRNLAWRIQILPVVTELNNNVAELRILLGELKGIRQSRSKSDSAISLDAAIIDWGEQSLRTRFDLSLNKLFGTLEQCEEFFEKSELITEREELTKDDRLTIREIALRLKRLKNEVADPDWVEREAAYNTVAELQFLSSQLPVNFQQQLSLFSKKVQDQYRWILIIVTTAGVFSGLLLVAFLRLSYVWVFRPLQNLIDGSRLVAAGHFGYRISAGTDDEIAELAESMNLMTDRFESIRADLDAQVRLRTQEVIRGERLASVGFLAAGIAHEINNPLASIAMCSESLQKRIVPLLKTASPNIDTAIIEKYLRMIQDEAFRCKDITEHLLDLSRTETENRQRTNLTSLVFGMTEMIAQHGKYHGKDVVLEMPEPVFADVNPQEMKQVTINLLTNALDAISPGGTVHISLSASDTTALLTFADDGCGMDPEVLKNIFQPFYTNRKVGKGNGLGLSITHKIISDHNGRITAESPGAGKGATFSIEIPLIAASSK